MSKIVEKDFSFPKNKTGDKTNKEYINKLVLYYYLKQLKTN